MPVDPYVPGETPPWSHISRCSLEEQTKTSQFPLHGLPCHARIVGREILALPGHGRRVAGVMHDGGDRGFIEIIDSYYAHRGIGGTLPVSPYDHRPITHLQAPIDVDFAPAGGRADSNRLEILLCF